MNEHTKTSQVLCLGEISWDRLWLLEDLPSTEKDYHLLGQKESPGGCALNSAVMLSGFNIPVVLAGNSLGGDEEGQKTLKYLAQFGLDKHLDIDPQLKTPFCQCLVSKKTGQRNFIIDHKNIDHFNPKTLKDLVQKTRLGHFSHIFVQTYLKNLSTQFLDAVQDSQAWLLTQDITPDHPAIGKVNCVQVSLNDSEDFSEMRLFELSQRYFRGRTQELLVTAGSRGAAFIRPNLSIEIVPALQVEAIDTTGCGDAFRAGFMAGLFKKQSISHSLNLGAWAGSIKAQHLGSHISTPLLKPLA